MDNNTNDQHQLLIKIKVVNKEDGWVNYWSLDKFEERLQLMKEVLDHFFSYNEFDANRDPFWDPNEMTL